VLELRMPFGPGYRVYFGIIGERVILLLLGGDKSTQARDIPRAQQFWRDYRRAK
jgi:putative addiction module killer protein